MNSTVLAVLCSALVGYLLGSLSFAIIVSRIYAHDDVRNYGSHNAGMTNVLRVYGLGPAAATLLGDFGKGILAVFLGRLIFETLGVSGMDAGYIAGLAALLGHLFPLWFGFRGGKGVLTSIGIMMAVNPLVMGMILLFFRESYALANNISVNAVFGFVLTIIGMNGVPEAIVAAVLVALIGKILISGRFLKS